MSNVKLMRGEGNLNLMRGVQYITRDIKKAKTWVLNHNGEVVDKYPEYGEFYLDEHGKKNRVHAKGHEKWGLEYYSNALQSYLASDDEKNDGTENKARYSLTRVLQNPDLIALMRGAQHVPKLVISRVNSPNSSKHIGVYTLKSLPRQTKFEVRRGDFGVMKSWQYSRFIDSQLALDFLAFLDKYALLIAKASLKLKTSQVKEQHRWNKRELEYAEAGIVRTQKQYDEWMVGFDDRCAQWDAQEAWLKTMPEFLDKTTMRHSVHYTSGAVTRDPSLDKDAFVKQLSHSRDKRDALLKKIKDYEEVHGGGEEE